MISLKDYWHIKQAVGALRKGGIIAYPTEAVYGLGCDPFSFKAVARLLQLKQRCESKGLILIASKWSQIKPLIKDLPEEILQPVLASWPGPVTWLLPPTAKVPGWIRGIHDKIAVRVTQHPIAKALCRSYGGPIVSTSANISSYDPARSFAEVERIFADKVDFILQGESSGLTNPTEIRDALSGQIIRSA